MKENIEFRQVRSFEEVLSGTLLFVKQNFKALLKTFFSLCGVFILGGMLSTIFMQLQMTDNMTASIQSGAYDGMSVWGQMLGLPYLLVILFLVLNYTAMYTSILSFVAVYIAKGNVTPTVEEVWTYFKYYFFRVLWSGLLVSIIWVVCTMFCLIPGIYVTPAFSIFYAIMILENADFGTAFGRAFALVKQNWWVTFATLLVIGIITGVCMMIVYMPSYILMMVSAFSGGGLQVLKGYQLFSAISQYLAQVFMIIPLVATAFIYFNLAERKESAGLMSRIEGFGNTPAPVSHPEEDY
ncbi:hypothetical protein [Pedobacter xixiisoli]|uniref:Membrane domain of glycerophosphoryl diester phosphodiesterase n=1 Tax=Pedobacter xixiisoli TaxID=1476464 RepID=A0A286AE99_9SPHI|nr:hypothetical protein [Pedobacter xixiisoli]SOD20220.1 hypothetical protein SAMN06297358_3933 [Pedobacter xixiisoli]